MGNYQFTAKTKDAKTIRDSEQAGTRQELIAKLRARGLFIVSIKEIVEKKSGAESGFFSMSLSFGKKRKRSSIKLYDLTFLARNLATTISSGVTLLRSLELLSQQAESAGLQKVLKEIGQGVKDGLSLGESVAKYPKVFSSLWQGIIEVGEASGNLPFVLERLADYLEMRMDFERKIKSALIYPAILVVAGFAAVIAFFKVILPKFTAIFDSFDVTLPLPTQIIFGISAFFENHFLLILGGITAVVIFIVMQKNNPAAKHMWDRVSLKLPIVGQFVTASCAERVTSTFYILLDSGLPLVYTLEVASKSAGNSVLEKNLQYVKEQVRKGASLSTELGKIKMFPMLIAEMSRVGEETGSLPSVFQKISQYYQKELSAKVERFVASFEPIMVIVMGVVIGGIVISLFLPMFKLAGGGGG